MIEGVVQFQTRGQDGAEGSGSSHDAALSSSSSSSASNSQRAPSLAQRMQKGMPISGSMEGSSDPSDVIIVPMSGSAATRMEARMKQHSFDQAIPMNRVSLSYPQAPSANSVPIETDDPASIAMANAYSRPISGRQQPSGRPSSAQRQRGYQPEDYERHAAKKHSPPQRPEESLFQHSLMEVLEAHASEIIESEAEVWAAE